MNPALRHFRKPWFTRWIRWLPPVSRLVPHLVIAAGIALAAPAGAQQAAGPTYGPVQRADTLWVLALRFRGDAVVSAQQAMIAVLRANPEAFVDGNINALRTGVTLRVPSAEEMAAVAPAEATAEFGRHEEAWRNRRRTGSAAPVAGPRPASQPASPPAAPSSTVVPDPADELREARATVVELRARLAERDDAIEDLLVQLAAVQRVPREAQGTAPAPSGETTGKEEQAGARDGADRTSWLPVSPLILGSALIVLLVLIVVVTLLRQRGEAEDTHPEEPYEEDGEDFYDEGDDGEPYEREDGREEPIRSGEGASGEAHREQGPSRSGAAPVAAGVVAAGVVAGATVDHGFAADDEAADPQEDERDDLPIGMDLEGEEDWGPDPGESSRGEPEPRDRESPSGFGRHIEVGELDELELDVGPAPGSFSELPEGLGEGDDPPEGTDPGRPQAGRRE